jgi:hypothetical protein
MHLVRSHLKQFTALSRTGKSLPRVCLNEGYSEHTLLQQCPNSNDAHRSRLMGYSED